MIDLPALILLLRPDLRLKFGFNLHDNLFEFRLWLVRSGIREYQALSQDQSFQKLLNRRAPGIGHSFTYLQYLIWIGRSDLQQAFPLPERSADFIHWFETHGVIECGLWDFLPARSKKKVLKHEYFWSTHLHQLESIVLRNDLSKLKGPLPYGVNLIGYAYGQLGIGEDIRMAVKAFEKAKIPFTVVNFPPGNDISQNDRTIDSFVSDSGPYAINIFCLTALETGRFYAEKGNNQFTGRYNIGYWPWELAQWPKDWKSLLALVDEVWVSSEHTYRSLLPICNKPLKLMPMVVQLGKIKPFSNPNEARNFFKLPTKATLFCFAFDLKSQLHRKNPKACIAAFLKAFPINEYSEKQVGLVIKVLKPTGKNRAWDKLKALAQHDSRIHIIENTLPRSDLLALYKTCDCYLSLHRAEGFGRGIAEALLLGLHVVTTGYSGNVDFCKAPAVDLVPYRLRSVGKGQYPFGDDQFWAEPDINQAARYMINFYHTHPQKLRHSHPAQKFIEFSPSHIGQRYLNRINEIYTLHSTYAQEQDNDLLLNDLSSE